VKIRTHLGTIVLTLAVAAVVVPAALAGAPRDGRSPDTKDAAIAAHSAGSVVGAPVDGRSPDTIDAALLAQQGSFVLLDGRSPDTVDAAIAAQQRSLAPLDGRSPDTVDAALAAQQSTLVDGRSPDTIDAALQAHSPVVTIIRSNGFDWGDFGIGFAVAVGSLLLLAGLGAGLIAARQSQKAGPATTA
jgi:hypothetical protein